VLQVHCLKDGDGRKTLALAAGYKVIEDAICCDSVMFWWNSERSKHPAVSRSVERMMACFDEQAWIP
jgi:hypothetical protein